jgi:predicted ester cyclase
MKRDSEIILMFVNELWNKRKLEVADIIFDENCKTYQLRSGAPMVSSKRGPSEIKKHISEWISAFNDLQFTIEKMFTGGQFVTTILSMDGTHSGNWLGIPPSGRQINIRMITIHLIEHKKIIEDWVIVESLGLFQQLGVLPSTEEILNEFRNAR